MNKQEDKIILLPLGKNRTGDSDETNHTVAHVLFGNAPFDYLLSVVTSFKYTLPIAEKDKFEGSIHNGAELV